MNFRPWNDWKKRENNDRDSSGDEIISYNSFFTFFYSPSALISPSLWIWRYNGCKLSKIGYIHCVWWNLRLFWPLPATIQFKLADLCAVHAWMYVTDSITRQFSHLDHRYRQNHELMHTYISKLYLNNKHYDSFRCSFVVMFVSKSYKLTHCV